MSEPSLGYLQTEDEHEYVYRYPESSVYPPIAKYQPIWTSKYTDELLAPGRKPRKPKAIEAAPMPPPEIKIAHAPFAAPATALLPYSLEEMKQLQARSLSGQLTEEEIQRLRTTAGSQMDAYVKQQQLEATFAKMQEETERKNREYQEKLAQIEKQRQAMAEAGAAWFKQEQQRRLLERKRQEEEEAEREAARAAPRPPRPLPVLPFVERPLPTAEELEPAPSAKLTEEQQRQIYRKEAEQQRAQGWWDLTKIDPNNPIQLEEYKLAPTKKAKKGKQQRMQGLTLQRLQKAVNLGIQKGDFPPETKPEDNPDESKYLAHVQQVLFNLPKKITKLSWARLPAKRSHYYRSPSGIDQDDVAYDMAQGFEPTFHRINTNEGLCPLRLQQSYETQPYPFAWDSRSLVATGYAPYETFTPSPEVMLGDPHADSFTADSFYRHNAILGCR